MKKSCKHVLWMTVLLMAGPACAVSIDSMRFYRGPEHTRVVLDVDGPVEHKVFVLENPDRLVIDIKGAHLNADLKKLNLKDSPVRRVRSGVQNKSDLRLVLDLKSKVHPKSFALAPQQQYGHRLVLDLYDSARPVLKTVQNIKSQGNGPRDIIVAIDAGHGGEDPGASGRKKTREKHVVLKIAKALKQQLDAEKGIKAVLVRSGDYYLKLSERHQRARDRYHADIFVSIHADAFSNPKARGMSVFALSRGGATSATAKYLAEKENLSDLIGGVALEDQSSIRNVLADMQMEGSMEHSIRMGELVLKQLGGMAKLHKSRVEQAGFAVLKNPEMVSILVETGFISNPGEEKKLNTRSYRKKIAQAITTGIRQYSFNYPIPGSYFANLKHSGYIAHTIVRGDSLSEVASQYRVPVKKIKEFNRLSTDIVRIGQVLKIPKI